MPLSKEWKQFVDAIERATGLCVMAIDTEIHKDQPATVRVTLQEYENQADKGNEFFGIPPLEEDP